MQAKQVTELLLQSLEHERGGVLVYETALECVVNEELHEELTKYLEETREHVQHLETVFEAFGLDLEQPSAGRQIVHDLGASLVLAMNTAMSAGDPGVAEIVACECVVIAETKDQLNWTLLAECAKKLTGEQGNALQAAVDEVQEQEDEHLYHSKGWCRELWMQALGMKAVLPPPEERKNVKTAIGAARAEQQRGDMR